MFENEIYEQYFISQPSLLAALSQLTHRTLMDSEQVY